MWEDARAWVYWNHSFDMHLSCLRSISFSFSSWVSTGLILRDICSGLMVVTSLVYWYRDSIFHSQPISHIWNSSFLTTLWRYILKLKKRLLFGRKAMTNLDSILKSWDITLSWICKAYSQRYDFSSSHIPIWELDHKEGWVSKNWCFQIVVLERLWRVPWTARRSNQSILKEINPELSLEGLMLSSSTLVPCCEEPTHWKRPWCWERLRAGGERDNRGWDGCMASWTQGTWVWANPGDGEGQGSLVHSVQGAANSQTRLSEQQQHFEYIFLYHLKYSSFI